MIRQKTGGYAVGDWLARLPHWIVVRVCPAVLLFGGLAHATPISGAPDKSQADSHAIVDLNMQSPAKPGENRAPGSSAASPQHDAAVYAATEASAGGCAFSSDCYPRIKVPEPQSLVLVGSGLLSMAGLIRSRMLR